ncbi:hypothetical protein [Parabacteroides sp.]
MNESKVICDFFIKTMSLRELKKRKGITVRESPFWVLVIPLIVFFILTLILVFWESLWLSILVLVLLVIYFSCITRIKDFGKIFIIEDGVEYLLYDYKKKELLNYLTRERFLSANISDNDRFYERLIDDCKEKSSILNDSITFSVFGILIILYDNALDELSWIYKIVLTLSMITILVILHLLRKIYYSSNEIGSFKRLLNVVRDLSLSNLKGR